jgi:hypothetical protein
MSPIGHIIVPLFTNTTTVSLKKEDGSIVQTFVISRGIDP